MVCTALSWRKNSQLGLSLLNPKFSECSAGVKVTLNFILNSVCEKCRMPFNDCQVNGRHPLPEEVCNSCSYVVPKILPVFEQPPVLLREILTSDSHQGKHFRKNIRQYNGLLEMASVSAYFVSRGPGVSIYNPTVTVHGRMYHEIDCCVLFHDE